MKTSSSTSFTLEHEFAGVELTIHFEATPPQSDSPDEGIGVEITGIYIEDWEVFNILSDYVLEGILDLCTEYAQEQLSGPGSI